MTFAEQLVGFKTIVIKEILRFSRIWVQTIIPPVITMSLYFVIFGNLIGSQIGAMDGVRYMDYIVPGLIMMAVITNSYANVVSSFYGCKFHRHIEEMLVSPLPNYLIIAGFMVGGIARGLAVGFAVSAVSLLFTPLNLHSPLVIVSTVILTSALFSLAGLICAFFFVTVASRIVGLVGVTSNPTSGMPIVTLLGTSVLFYALGWTDDFGKVTVLTIKGPMKVVNLRQPTRSSAASLTPRASRRSRTIARNPE